ncbi:histidine--tRNA ligase [Litorivicinus sp.]|nr:histidine--tRNA ligase [Litorivicinus sp.]MDC1240259.1 histidine--tRNA ligase [Litorivicinus sp.]
MTIQSVRGMPDILPEQSGGWLFLEQTVAALFSSYGLVQVRTPVVEETRLFARAVGDVTDIVEKEMYSFDDRSGESLTLRPELTAGVVRAVIEHGMLHNQTQRLWYQGPAFRYERPQKGRYRQFHQIGVECFGFADSTIEAELIELTDHLWRALGIRDALDLEINSIGSVSARESYKTALVAFLHSHFDSLDEESQSRLERNPLRILDTKNSSTQALLANAPALEDYLTKEDSTHFEALCLSLDQAGIRYRKNPRLVRGLDYYGRTVFEWMTHSLGAQGTVCGGGRYDGLVQHLGGRATPGVGFALGMERVVLLMETLGVIPAQMQTQADIYLMIQNVQSESTMRSLAREIRFQIPGLRVMTHIGGGSLKSQLKKADKSGADIGLIIGEDELKTKSVVYKPLRGGDQETLPNEEVVKRLKLLRDM